MHQLQSGSPSGTTCIGSKFGHQLAPFALLPKLATRLHHCIATLPSIALLALSVSIELVSSSARVTSVKSYKPLVVSDGHPDPKIGPQGYLGPIKIVGDLWHKSDPEEAAQVVGTRSRGNLEENTFLKIVKYVKIQKSEKKEEREKRVVLKVIGSIEEECER